MFRIYCPHCGSDRIGVCRTTRYVYFPESLRSIKENFAIVEESVEELRNDGIDVCSFFCCNCIKNIKKEEFKVNRFVINGEEFF